MCGSLECSYSYIEVD